MEKNKRGERLVLTDSEIEEEMLGQIAARAIPSIEKENERLTETLFFLEDAVSFGGIDNLMWVRSVIYILIERDRRAEFMERIPPENNLHGSHPGVKKFAKYLVYWRKTQVLHDQHLVWEATDIIAGRLAENLRLLGRFPR